MNVLKSRMQNQKIYLAGFDVFYANALEVLALKKQLCQRYGFVGLAPLDNSVDMNAPKAMIRKSIYEANIKMIEESDIVCANLNAFRHGEPDAGTVFEIGYAKALGKRVYVYVESNESMLEKTKAFDTACVSDDNAWWDHNGLLIEDFDAPFNLMISESCQIVHGDLEDVLRKIK